MLLETGGLITGLDPDTNFLFRTGQYAVLLTVVKSIISNFANSTSLPDVKAIGDVSAELRSFLCC